MNNFLQTGRDHWKKALIWIGGGALLLVMAVEVAAVIGRHLGLPLLGSIEIVQAAILVSASSAIFVASLAKSHAVVQLFLSSLSPPSRKIVDHIMALACACFFGALLAGSLWIAYDMWPGHEESEVLHLSYKPLRIAALVSLLSIVILYLRRTVIWRRNE